ncbi:MAG: T9SS type A sorting domain-containing protein [Bacteroidota bacterium]
MKKTALFALMSICLQTFAQLPYFQQNHSCSTIGIEQDDPVDIHFDDVNKVYSYHTGTNGGMIVAKYNSGTGAVTDMVYMSKSGLPFYPIRVRTQGTDYYALFNIVVGGYTRFCLVKLDAATNAIAFVRQVTNTTGTLDMSAVDFVHDGGTNVYVLSNCYDAVNAQTDLGVTKIDVSTATPTILWNYRYENLSRDEFGSNIIVQGTSLFASSISVNLASMLDRGPTLLKLDLNGGYLASRMYKYADPCLPARSGGTWVMPGKSLTLSSISYVGADGNGPLWLAKIDPLTLNMTLQAHYISGAAYMNPEIQPIISTAGNKVLMSGSAPFYNTATPGYVHYFFDFTTLAFSQGTYYSTTNPSHWAGVIYDTYINTGMGKNIFTVAQNNGVVNNYHLLKTSDLGDNACDTSIVIMPSFCTVDYYDISFVQRDNPAILSLIKSFSLIPVADNYTELCYVTCTGCELAPMDDPAIVTKSVGTGILEGGVEAYPNPTTGLIYLKATGTLSEVVVYSLLGKKIPAGVQISNSEASIDLSDEPKGFYLLRFLMNGELKSIRILKD